MWGPTLFCITILLVTPSGRGVVATYATDTLTRFAEQQPYSYLTLVSMAALALAMLLMMRRRRPKRSEVSVSFIWREIHGPEAPAVARPVQKTRRRRRIGFSLSSFLTRA